MRLQLIAVLLHTLRIIGYKLCFYLRQCSAPFVQMSLYTSLQSSLASLSSYLSQAPRSRKVVLFVVLLVLLILYMVPSWFTGGNKHQIDILHMCVESKLGPFRDAALNYDLVLNYPRDTTEGGHRYLPYVGNGLVGVVVEESAVLYIRSQRALSTPVKYYPVIHVSVPGLQSSEGNAIDFVNGLIYKIQCFQLGTSCVTAASQTYAHRTRPSLLIQEYRLYNPTDTKVAVDIDLTGPSEWVGAQTTNKRVTANGVEYSLTFGTVPLVGKEGQIIPIAIASVRPPEAITVNAGSTWKYQGIMSVKYAEGGMDSSSKSIQEVLEKLKLAAEQELQSAVGTAVKYLRQEHVQAWHKLWSSGFGISLSRAKGALNGDRINATMYYVMSHLPAPIHEVARRPEERYNMEKLLYYPDRCYEGHHTLQNQKMWADIQSVDGLIAVINIWIITLEKQGCSPMLRAGADGAIQAMMLSLGELQFKNDHLEFHIHPRDLHRDYFFRRINYGNNTHVNISVVVNDNNKAELYVAMDKNDRQYYACDAGCLDTPVKLSKQWVQFPVKVTEPWTSVLYITADHQHMEELKHIIHVKEIVEAPAHEHHVIALHRHGHHYGGLPMMFWVSIGFLIVIFHLFLFKLIINEYCQTDKYTRSRYNL